MLDGKPLNGFYSNKASALIAYLALTRRAPTRDALAALLWGEMRDADAKMNLRQCLTNLRKLLAPHLLITRDSVEFNFDAPYALDVEAFEHKLRARDLSAAVELYTGDFLDGVFVRDAPDFEEWMLAQRARLRDLALQAMSTLVSESAACGDNARGIEYATRLIALDPWREETHRELMVMLARIGQRSVALQQYEICKRELREQMGVEPSAETTALYERIRAAGTTVKHNLTPPATNFVGRARELAQIETALLKRECRLITLLGVGGIGKTRLARQAAERALALGAFLNGVYFVPLAEIDSTDLLVAAIANACEFTFSGKADPKTQLANFLREKEILLVLDNFDHLLDAATWLSELQKRAPSVKFLITSRERLNVQAEWLIALDGLDAPTAAQLFIERACQVRGDFDVGDAARAHIARVCELVEGLPLGIELAAAWASTHAIEEIAHELERGFDFLATTRRDAPERQRSLRAVFEHAWQLLEPDARAVFARLAIFRGGFTRAAAEHIARASFATLTALVDKSLVRRDSAGRFSLHPMLAQYAEEKLDATRAQISQAHRDYFADWMTQCATRLHGAQERATIAEMNADIENVRAAWWHAVATAQLDTLLKFVPGLYRLYDLQSRYREGEELFGKAVDALGGVSSDAHGIVAAKIRARQAALWIDVGQATRAAETLQECLARFRALNEVSEILFCLKNLGNAARVTGKYAEGKIFYTELLELGRAHNALAEVAVALNNLGILANSTANYVEAKRLHRECLELRRAMGDRAAMASTLLNLGVVHTDLGEYDDAEPLIRQAMEICNEFGDRRRLAATNTNLGSIMAHRGRDVEAKELYAHALALHRETGYRLGIAVALNNVGTAALRLGDDREAEMYLRAALAEARESKFDFVALDALVWFAALQSKSGKLELAAELLALVLHHPASDNESLTIARKHFAELGAKLPKDARARAEERGRARQLEETVAEILQTK